MKNYNESTTAINSFIENYCVNGLDREARSMARLEGRSLNQKEINLLTLASAKKGSTEQTIKNIKRGASEDTIDDIVILFTDNGWFFIAAKIIMLGASMRGTNYLVRKCVDKDLGWRIIETFINKTSTGTINYVLKKYADEYQIKKINTLLEKIEVSIATLDYIIIELCGHENMVYETIRLAEKYGVSKNALKYMIKIFSIMGFSGAVTKTIKLGVSPKLIDYAVKEFISKGFYREALSIIRRCEAPLKTIDYFVRKMSDNGENEYAKKAINLGASKDSIDYMVKKSADRGSIYGLIDIAKKASTRTIDYIVKVYAERGMIHGALQLVKLGASNLIIKYLLSIIKKAEKLRELQTILVI